MHLPRVVHAYASLPHYAAHLAPILAAVPEEQRGLLWAARPGQGWGPPIPPELEQPGADWFLVAGLADGQRLAQGHRPLVYVEHGAGQTYVGLEDHGSYSGGNHVGLDVRLYLCPNEHVAARWRARGAQAAVVGCPRLDQHAGRRTGPRGGRPLVAFTWHWQCDLVPETWPAFAHYEQHLPALFDQLRADGITVVGHAHPRYWGRLARWYRELGIPHIEDLDVVLDAADVLVADNTSALYEAAAVGVDVVCLNAPWYRRDVEHGLRFWEVLPGVQVDEPGDLRAAIESTVAGAGSYDLRALRDQVFPRVYAQRPGTAALAAAAAILEALG